MRVRSSTQHANHLDDCWETCSFAIVNLLTIEDKNGSLPSELFLNVLECNESSDVVQSRSVPTIDALAIIEHMPSVIVRLPRDKEYREGMSGARWITFSVSLLPPIYPLAVHSVGSILDFELLPAFRAF